MADRFGATRHVAIVILGALLALTACTSGGDPSPRGGTSAPEGDQGVSVLEKLTGDQLCELLTTAAIERELDTTVAESEGKERGRAPVMQTPYFLTRECDYETGTFDLSADVSTKWDEETSDEEVLDDVFTDSTKEPETVGAYEQVPDLGTLAGFGPDSVLAGADVAGRYLGVVFHLGEERLLLTLHTLGKAELAQLRPLAEELLAGLEDKLR